MKSILPGKRNTTGIWGGAMGAADGPPVPAGPGQAFLPAPGRGVPGSFARYCGRDNKLRDVGRKPVHSIVAAGVVVAILLCMFWVHTARIPSGFAVPSNHASETTAWIKPAGTSSGRCTVKSALVRSHLLGKDPFRRGLSDLRQQPVRVFLSAYVRSQKSVTDTSEHEQSPDGASGITAQGWRTLIEVPDIACRFMGYRFRAGHQAASPRPPFGHPGHGIGGLDFRGWAAEGPIRPKDGNCAADEAAEGAQRLDSAVPGPGKRGIVLISQVDSGSYIGQRGDQMQETPSVNPALICVMIRENRQGGGDSAPEQWCGSYGGSGGQVGSGDRASLPGRSTRYRVIWLVCPRCGTRLACVFYDEGDMPLCVNPLHGRMEVQR